MLSRMFRTTEWFGKSISLLAAMALMTTLTACSAQTGSAEQAGISSLEQAGVAADEAATTPVDEAEIVTVGSTEVVISTDSNQLVANLMLESIDTVIVRTRNWMIGKGGGICTGNHCDGVNTLADLDYNLERDRQVVATVARSRYLEEDGEFELDSGLPFAMARDSWPENLVQSQHHARNDCDLNRVLDSVDRCNLILVNYHPRQPHRGSVQDIVYEITWIAVGDPGSHDSDQYNNPLVTRVFDFSVIANRELASELNAAVAGYVDAVEHLTPDAKNLSEGTKIGSILDEKIVDEKPIRGLLEAIYALLLAT